MPTTSEQKRIKHEQMRELLDRPYTSFKEVAEALNMQATSIHRVYNYYRVPIPDTLRKHKKGLVKCSKCRTAKSKVECFRQDQDAANGIHHECLDCEAKRPQKKQEPISNIFNPADFSNWLVY